MKFRYLVFLFLFSCVALSGQGVYQAGVWKSSVGDSLPYRLMLPKEITPSKLYPLVIFLHGAGERGRDNSAQLKHAAGLFADEKNREKFPAFVVFPQCPQGAYWATLDMTQRQTANVFTFNYKGRPNNILENLFQCIPELMSSYPVDPDRVYIMGLSMGGMGTLEAIARHPELFAGAVSICGAGELPFGSVMAQTPLWLFHGAKDDIVPHHHSRLLYDVLTRHGGSTRYTEYPEANHNSWDAALAEKDLLNWLFLQRKSHSPK